MYHICCRPRQVAAVLAQKSTHLDSSQHHKFYSSFLTVIFFVVLPLSVVACLAVKGMRISLRTGSRARAVLYMVGGTARKAERASTSKSQAQGAELLAVRRAFGMYCNGVANNAERKMLLAYFDGVEKNAVEQRRRWEARDAKVWVFVSSPEFSVDGQGVMDYIVSVCDQQPWQFKQGFDWASSGARGCHDCTARCGTHPEPPTQCAATRLHGAFAPYTCSLSLLGLHGETRNEHSQSVRGLIGQEIRTGPTMSSGARWRQS